MKIKKLTYLLILFLFLLSSKPAAAADPVRVHFFWAKGCPHCEEEQVFLDSLQEKYPQLEVKSYEVTSSREAADLLRKVGDELSLGLVSGSQATIPFTTVGENYISGYLSDEVSGKQIEEAVLCAIENRCQDVVELVSDSSEESSVDGQEGPSVISVPILGEVNIKNLSLPALTFVIGLLDGFNPCAMWVLLFLITLLLGMENKRRMWILGIVFIAASAFVYFLFMSAWLNLFLFLGFVLWVRVMVGLVALAAGGYNLRDYFTNKDGTCQVAGADKRKKVFTRMKAALEQKNFILALIGLAALAFAVNLIELVCSAGLPAVYTQVLSLASLPTWQYYLYLLFYVFVFMLDDLAVFAVAMVTLQAVGVSGKYTRYSHLIGGAIMVIIGLLMLFKPEVLMFG